MVLILNLLFCKCSYRGHFLHLIRYIYYIDFCKDASEIVFVFVDFQKISVMLFYEL